MRASAADGDRSIRGGHRGENAASPTYIAIMKWPWEQGEPVTDRMALFWCTTDELRLLRTTINSETRSFIRISEEEARPLSVKPEDVDWALPLSIELDRAKEK